MEGGATVVSSRGMRIWVSIQVWEEIMRDLHMRIRHGGLHGSTRTDQTMWSYRGMNPNKTIILG